MDLLGALGAHWIEIVQTLIFVAGFFVTIHTIREETKERKIQNLFALTEAHRDIWSRLYDKPELNRILRHEVDVAKEPPTDEEELFVQMLILHLRTSYKARQMGMGFDDGAVSEDIRQFFGLPIPQAVWQKMKIYQDSQFLEFVESSLKGKESPRI
jgi:hypothetical protein